MSWPSVVIFDDIDNITTKRQKEAVYDILNDILGVGRHHKITCIVTMHSPTNGRETRRILNEAHAYVYFPHSAGGKIKYLLQEYLDIDKNMIRYFKNAHSRWCCIFKNYPMAYMLEHEIGMSNTTDSDSDGDDGGGGGGGEMAVPPPAPPAPRHARQHRAPPQQREHDDAQTMHA